MGDPSHLERMGRELKCPICLSLLNAAVSLTCNHVFCNCCMVKSVKSGFKCPVCKLPFQRREIRAAPHMDNLVSIYKSMEVASGFSIFVTQNSPPEEQKKIEGEMDTGKENIDRNWEGSVEFQQTSKLQRSRRCNQSDQEALGQISLKPAFPAKKRVQVPRHSLPEATTSHEKTDDRLGESIKDGPGSSMILKEKLVPCGKGELVLSPFFWLRDEEADEISSQHVDEDQLLDASPPHIPTFSDIKGSDDRNSSEASPMGEVCGKSVFGDLYDSEMFEWTQRPCSPELLSSPVKLQAEDTCEDDGIQETRSKAPLLAACTNGKPSMDSKECASNVDEMLPDVSSLRVKNTKQIGQHKSNKRCKNSGEASLKKCSKKNVEDNLDVPVDTALEPENSLRMAVLENKDSSSCEEKARKKTKRSRSCTSASDSRTEIVMPPTRVETLGLGNQKVASELKSSSGKKQQFDKPLKMKKTEKVCHKISTPCLRGHSSRSRKRSLDSTKLNSVEEIYPIQTQMNEVASLDMLGLSAFQVNHKSSLANKGKINKSGEEVEPLLASKCNQNLRSKKKMKASFHNIAEDMVVDCQVGCSNVSAKEIRETKSSGKACNVSSNETWSNKSKCQLLLGKHSEVNGSAFHQCNIPPNKIQCAFCLSSEDSEASGEMVHYYNGRNVTADYNGGSKVLHSHRNCAEWAPNVYFEDDIAVNLEAEVTRSRRIKCCCCGLKGAALGCYEKSCRKSFHVPCAKLTPQCRWDTENFVMLCPLHIASKLPNECSVSQLTRKTNYVPKRKTLSRQLQCDPKHDKILSQSWNSNIAVGKLVVCCSALTVGEREIVSEFERLSGVTVLKKWDSSVTHVVASTDENGACRRTLKTLMGILEGKWILNLEWVKSCMKAMKIVQEEQFEIAADVHGIRGGPQQGRLRLLNKQPKIFHGLKYYLMGDFLPSYKGYMQDLVVAGGGTILHRKPISRDQDAQLLESSGPTFIIYSLELPEKHDSSKKSLILSRRQSDAEALATSVGAKAVSSAWVFNSIAACKMQSFS